MNKSAHRLDQELLEAEKRIHERYEWLHIANDYVSAILFLVGSVLFLWESWQTVATWFFIIGSVFFLFAPILRTLNKRYVRNLRKGPIHW
ncbi:MULTISPECIES: YrhK family protein [Marinobacter]|uniref:YrhK family protein n=1 Tax=Marinobacter TaxID=2742 RepID=UPI000DAB9D91|nr:MULTISPECIES: YrhK family protein [Marinobacter]